MALHSRAGSGGRHRADNVAERLRTENGRLHRENDELACQTVQLTTRLHRALLDKQAAEETAMHLAGELAAAVEDNQRLRAELANARAVSVPPMVRDTSNPADVATSPTGTDVRTLRLRFEGDGIPRRLGAGHRPSWARHDQEGAA